MTAPEHTLTITCLCPTYRRPARLVANAIACFDRQTYPAAYRRLIVLDDSGGLVPQCGPGWQIVSVVDRYPTLPAKYNALVALAAGADALAVWEDDDIYLPWHLEAHAAALARAPWSHPKRVWSLYGGSLHQEPAGGRFHAALAFRRDALLDKAIGGWIETPRGDFDQQLLAALSRRFGTPGDPCDGFAPSYVFRWGSTGSYHGQAFMGGDGIKGDWYARIPEGASLIQGSSSYITPQLDEETIHIFDEAIKLES